MNRLAIRRLHETRRPIFNSSDGGVAPVGNQLAPSRPTVFDNITSIIGSVSQGVSSVFGALTFNKQAQMLGNVEAQRRQNNANTFVWIGGAVLLVVVLYVLVGRKK